MYSAGTLAFIFTVTCAINLIAQPTVVTLSSSASSPIFGQAVTLSATVAPLSATGKVTFYDGATVLGTNSLNGGQASLQTILLRSGKRLLRAYYPGDATYAPGSATLPLTIGTVPANTMQRHAIITNPEYGNDGVGCMAVADFNGDGKLDLAIYTFKGLEVLLGNGDGSFQPPQVASASLWIGAIAAADFDGDGNVDIAFTNSSGVFVNGVPQQTSVTLLLGNGDGTFQPGNSYNISQTGTSYGIRAVSLAVGDFNGDGKPDLAAGGSEVSIFLGNGDGTFQPSLTYPSVGTASMILLGDFNGDGIADLAVSNLDGASVLLGNGDGTFQDPVNYVTGYYANSLGSLAIGDFNGDGNADLAIPDKTGTTIFLGNGDGTFQRSDIYHIPYSGFLAVVDFNGDGFDDVAAGTTVGTLYGGSVYVLTAAGQGFSPPLQYSIPFAYPLSCCPRYINGIAVADFNGDGIPDFAVPSGNGLDILIGKSAASSVTSLASSPNPSVFEQSVTITATVSPSTATGTVNLYDGLKLTATGALRNGQALLGPALPAGNHSFVAIYSGDANYGYSTSASLIQTVNQTTTAVTANAWPNPSVSGKSVVFTATIADPRAGGIVSLMEGPTVLGSGIISAGVAPVATSALSPGVHVLTLLYQGDPNFSSSASPPVTELVRQESPASVTLGSSTNPVIYGQALLLTATISPPAATGSITFYDGTIVLGAAPVTKGMASLKTILAHTGSRSLKAYYGGDAVYTPSQSASWSQTVVSVRSSGLQKAIALGANFMPIAADLNGDGRLDLLGPISDGSIMVLLGNGDGTFADPKTYPAGTSADAIALGDFNGDEIPDVTVYGYGPNGVALYILLGNGDGSFQSPVLIRTPQGTAVDSMAVADFNADGKADLVLANYYGNVGILLGNGDGTFQPEIGFGALSNPVTVAVGDVNGDGKPDIVVGYFGSNISVLLGNGDGTFQPAVDYQAGSNVSSFLVADLNGDGYDDIVINGYPDGVAVMLSNGNGTFMPPAKYPVAQSVFSWLAMGDMDGDGKADIVVGGNGVTVLMGNGDGTFQAPVGYPVSSSYPTAIALGDFNGDGRTDVAVSALGLYILLAAP